MVRLLTFLALLGCAAAYVAPAQGPRAAPAPAPAAPVQLPLEAEENGTATAWVAGGFGDLEWINCQLHRGKQLVILMLDDVGYVDVELFPAICCLC